MQICLILSLPWSILVIKVLCLFANKLQLNSNASSREEYILLVKSNKLSIINAAFWLVELLLGYML